MELRREVVEAEIEFKGFDDPPLEAGGGLWLARLLPPASTEGPLAPAVLPK